MTNADGTKTTLQQFDTHALYGHMQAKATCEIMCSSDSNEGANPFSNLRKLIDTRSTFAGSGSYAQHSLSRLGRTYDAMKASIAGIMNMNMFGIPFTGADVCGDFSEDFNQT